MKKLSVILGLSLAIGAARAALPQPDLLAHIHFAGAQTISAAPNAHAFTNEFCSPEALALRTQTSAKLSVWLAGWMQSNLNVTVPDAAAKLRPLLEDLQTAEWSLEARVQADGKPSVLLAVKPEASKAQLWRTSLIAFHPNVGEAQGWLFFEFGGKSLLNLGLLRAPAAPKGWLDLDINWPRLAQWYPALKELALPETQLVITAPDDNFRVSGKLLFPQDLAITLDPWRVPTNTVHQPFNSFTAVRGFAGWLQSQAWAQPYQLSPEPNQLFVWSLPMFPFQTYAAVPVPDAGKAFAQEHSAIVPALAAANAKSYFMMPVTASSPTNNEINFTGMPFVSPYLKAIKEAAGQFLLWETFPNTPRSKPLPPELFQRLATKDLVLYHWEITAERIPQLLQVSQFGLMITQHKQLEGTSAAFKWLQRAGAKLGNTDTEITKSGPAEMTFTRKAPGIFTAPEMFALANWLEATNFPGCNLKLPPHPAHPKRPHLPGQPQTPQILSAPLPVPGH